MSTDKKPMAISFDLSGAMDPSASSALFWNSVITNGLVHSYADNWYTNKPVRMSHFKDWQLEASTVPDEDGDMSMLLFRVTPEGHQIILKISGGRETIGFKCASNSEDAVKQLVKRLRKLYPQRPTPTERITADFYYLSANGPSSVTRVLDAPDWKDIRANYPQSVREELDDIFHPDWRPSGGQLMLMHGVPGCGKTYVIRSLSRMWRSWARVSYITDTDALLANASYLMQVLLRNVNERGYRESEGSPKWHLIILEDSGELLSKSARGQAVSRLLNSADGMLGQGLNVMFMITTNEDLGELHEALSRPGRCMLNVEFGRLNRAESDTWLSEKGSDIRSSGENTLAELYSMMRGKQTKKKAPRKVGFGA